MLRAGWALGTWDMGHMGAGRYWLPGACGEDQSLPRRTHKKIGVNGIMIYWGAVAVAPGTDGDLAPPRLPTLDSRSPKRARMRDEGARKKLKSRAEDSFYMHFFILL